MQNTALAITLGLSLVGLVSTFTGRISPASAHPDSDVYSHAYGIRASGPAGLAEVLAKYDAMKPGPERDTLALLVDKVAGQRYATVSRLYWYTNLELAKEAAATQGKPILALRMLGDLDEDLSCANSRLFRATLYSNKDVSAFMRDNFILYWSSEREVPKVTIDMGDGRQIKTTITGNSAHYVLAADGSVLDVLPGVYAPKPFHAELTKTLVLAKTVAKLDADKRRAAVIAYHTKAAGDFRTKASTMGYVGYLPNQGGLTTDADMQAAAWQAQRSTMSKARIEVPLLREVSFDKMASIDPNDTTAWGALAQAWWGDRTTTKPTPGQPPVVELYPQAPAAKALPTAPVLDATSRALVLAIDGGTDAREAERAAMLRRLELNLVADSGINELRLRPQIRARLVAGETDFSKLNEYVYAEVFHTPKSDAWLGLAPRTDFTGLPGDGLMVPTQHTALR